MKKRTNTKNTNFYTYMKLGIADLFLLLLFLIVLSFLLYALLSSPQSRVETREYTKDAENIHSRFHRAAPEDLSKPIDEL